jgi:dsDNA-specific endonuclease/ATPase MutS2
MQLDPDNSSGSPRKDEAAGGAENPFTGPVRLPMDGVLDLHAFRPRDVRDVVLEYLEECHRLGIWRIRIVHGKGIGQLREIVHNTLRGHPAVQEFRLAGSAQGGWGATVVDLQRSAGSGSDKQDPAR